jgi:hypothetical protein
MNYLIAFIKICEKNYKTKRKDESTAVKFLATAYNYGFEKNSDAIESMIGKKFFSTKLFKTTNYSYADISMYWYLKYLTDK